MKSEIENSLDMKKISLFIIFVFGVIWGVCGQNIDSLMVQAKPLTEIQRDSIFLDVRKDLCLIANDVTARKKNSIGRYKMYRTTNIFNNLKLDTTSGRVTGVQIGINDENKRFEYVVCDAIEDDWDWRIVGRYELYPTGNMYNFILVDTILGLTYQVQWGTTNNCGIWPIR